MSTIFIIGLGNPGKKYERTRHNAGFLALDYFHKHAGVFTPWKESKKYSSFVSKGAIEGHDIILAKPQTYMNLSGNAAQKLVCHTPGASPPTQHKSKILNLESVIVISDDLALPFGSLRIRSKGSAGGHNGLKSIIDHLGTEHFMRLRIGIASDAIPRTQAEEFVLKPFSQEEQKMLAAEILPQASEALAMLVTRGIEAAQQIFNPLASPQTR